MILAYYRRLLTTTQIFHQRDRVRTHRSRYPPPKPKGLLQSSSKLLERTRVQKPCNYQDDSSAGNSPTLLAQAGQLSLPPSHLLEPHPPADYHLHSICSFFHTLHRPTFFAAVHLHFTTSTMRLSTTAVIVAALTATVALAAPANAAVGQGLVSESLHLQRRLADVVDAVYARGVHDGLHARDELAYVPRNVKE